MSNQVEQIEEMEESIPVEDKRPIPQALPTESVLNVLFSIQQSLMAVCQEIENEVQGVFAAGKKIVDDLETEEDVTDVTDVTDENTTESTEGTN
tara:strand:- start:4636 stop:4917 length:282 start_codon:yes stop_codon:yes gene_type:complete